ncbi:hypothetical protein SSX86_010023 [Deinandra increscens subsp. villosa]|uniref:HTH La-type RNA-binding domain-containing protein n=1 Tax=Deinandra increscens subsp. villosa TaxID=3103831 RepID=A0AAP0DI29_9ASTR
MAATNVQSSDAERGVVASASPWSQIVRGVSEGVSPAARSAPASPASPASPSSVQDDDLGAESQADNASKKPVWNRPSPNGGVVDAFSPVMGAAWPALGESTKPTLKSSSSESLKTLSDGSLSPALQVTGSSSPSHKQASVVSMNSTSTTNHVAPSRQKSLKRGGGNSSANVSANGVVSQQPTSHDSVVEGPHNTSEKVNAGEQPSPREHAHREPQKGGFVSQSHSGNDHHHQRGSYRRGNGGSYHHNYGGKRDHDRGNQEWNQHSRSFNNRDTHLQSQRGFPRGYVRPSVHTSASFVPPLMHVPMQPFGNNMMYPDVAPPVIYAPGPHPPPMPFGPPLSPQVYYVASDPLLNANIVAQIDYYFSNENLVKDTYLRRNMDEQGWVSAGLIAGFKKVSSLTDNVQLILDVMRTSTIVEVQGDKIRRRNDWMKWIMPAPGQYLNPSSPQANHEGLVSQVQGLVLHGPASTNQVPVETQFSRSNSEELTGGEETVGVTSQQAGFDHPSAA